MTLENIKFHVDTIMKAVDKDTTMIPASKSTLKAAVKLLAGFLENNQRQTRVMEELLEELKKKTS